MALTKLVEKQSEALLRLAKLALTLNNARLPQEALDMARQLDPGTCDFPVSTLAPKTESAQEYVFVDSADTIFKA